MLQEIENLLLKIRAGEPCERLNDIKELQHKVWYEIPLEDSPINDFLFDLIYDLDFYDEDERTRTLFPDDYGDRGLERTIKTALWNLTVLKEESLSLENYLLL
jgi:hypothetical protein